MSKMGDHLIDVMNAAEASQDLIKRFKLEKSWPYDPKELTTEIAKVLCGEDMGEDLFEALFDSPLAEGMPYGTMKGRTGDPTDWLTERLRDEANSR